MGSSAAVSLPADTLPRVLGPLDGAALVVANVVGAGIFITPGIVAGMVDGPLAVLSLWLAGGLLALAGASAYAELAARRPEAGGEFLYITVAFGRLPGFLSGWTSFVAGFSGAIAATAVGFAEYLGRLIPMAADSNPIFSLSVGPAAISVSPRTLVALGVLALFTTIHARGTRSGMTIQNLLVGLKLILGVGLLAAALTWGDGRWDRVVAAPERVQVGGWLLALVPVMFTYSGWNAAAYLAEEIHDPQRNVWRALLLGTLTVVGLYMMVNVVLLYGLSASGLALETAVGEAVTHALFGPEAAAVMTLLILVALGTGLSAMIVTGPRVYLAMARRDLFPRSLARLHRDSGTPRRGLYAQAGWAAVLILTGGLFELVTYTGFAILVFSAAAVAGLFVLRHRDPRRAPVQAWGYPVVPALFIATCLAAMANAILRAPGPSMGGLVVILAGIPVYLGLRTRHAKKPGTASTKP